MQSAKKSRGVLIAVIAVATLVVGANVAAAALYRPDEVAKGKLEEMARAYYEDYFWPQISDYSVMADYYKGFQVSLGALLVYDEGRNAGLAGYFDKFNCDIRETYAKITPREPYGRGDYDVVFGYSCDF